MTNQFFAEQTANIAKLAALLLASVYKVSVPVVDYDHVFIHIEFFAPHFSRRPVVGLAGESFA